MTKHAKGDFTNENSSGKGSKFNARELEDIRAHAAGRWAYVKCSFLATNELLRGHVILKYNEKWQKNWGMIVIGKIVSNSKTLGERGVILATKRP